MDAVLRVKVSKLRIQCTAIALDGQGDTPLDAVTRDDAKLVLNLPIAPKMTYNELLKRLDLMVRGF
jgi:hypothetical protein